MRSFTTAVFSADSIEFDNATGTLPLHVPPHNGRVTLTGLVPPTLVGQSSEFNISNATQLDFGGLFPVMYLEPGTIMSFENLILKGIASKKSPAVTALGLPFAVGFEVFPAVAPLQNTTVIFNNTMIFEYFPSSCSESDLQQVQRNLQSLFGGARVAGVRTDPPSVWLQGLHSFPVAIKGANGSTIGTMTIVSDKVAFGCLVDPYWSDSNLADHQPVVVNNAPFSSTADGSHASGSGGSTSSSSTLSSGAVAGIVVGAVVFACLLFIMAVFIVRRRRGHKRGAPFFEASTRGNKLEDGIASGYWDAATETSDGSAHKVPLPLGKTGDVQEMHHRLGVASALKVRFGSIEGLEIGQLIGRGAHGRIYKATFRGVPVAVKVVESSIGPDKGADSLEDVSAEAIFLTALAHPNIVRMFRVATIKLQDRSSTDCQLSQRLDLASPLASGDQNNNSNAWLSSSDDQRSSNSKNNQDIFGMISGPGQYETWLVMEFCEKGSLDRALRRRKHFSPLQEKVYVREASMIHQILLAFNSKMILCTIYFYY